MIPLFDPLKFHSVLREIQIKHNDVQKNSSRNDNVEFFSSSLHHLMYVCVIQFSSSRSGLLSPASDISSQNFSNKGAFVWNHQSRERELSSSVSVKIEEKLKRRGFFPSISHRIVWMMCEFFYLIIFQVSAKLCSNWCRLSNDLSKYCQPRNKPFETWNYKFNFCLPKWPIKEDIRKLLNFLQIIAATFPGHKIFKSHGQLYLWFPFGARIKIVWDFKLLSKKMQPTTTTTTTTEKKMCCVFRDPTNDSPPLFIP